MSDTAAGKPPLATTVLEGWRGPPELMAHILSVMQRVTTDGNASTSELVVDISIKNDHELFSSPGEFLTAATMEALRHFKRIDATCSGSLGFALLTIRWTRPWWSPGGGLNTSDGVVELQLSGPDEWAARAHQTILDALRRGWRPINWKGFGAALVALIFAGFAVFCTLVGAFLFDWRDPVIWALIAGGVGLIFGAFAGTWIVPTLEIAPRRESRLARTGKSIGSVMVSLAIAGIAKALWG